MGLIAGPDKTAESRAQARFPRLGIDRQRDERVHQRESVGAGLLGGFRQGFDPRDVGRKFHDQGPPSDLAHRSHNLGKQTRVARKEDPTVLGVGTRDVELVGGDAFGIFEHADDFEIVFDGVAEHVGEYRGAGRAQLGQLFGDESPDADVLQARWS